MLRVILAILSSVSLLFGDDPGVRVTMELVGGSGKQKHLIVYVSTGDKPLELPLSALYDRSIFITVKDLSANKILPNLAGGGPPLNKKIIRVPSESDISFFAYFPKNEALLDRKPGIYELRLTYLPGEPLYVRIRKDGEIEEIEDPT